MKWELRTPSDWPENVREGRVAVLCATTEQGEYSIHEKDGTFALFFKGAPLTGYTYFNAMQLMDEAEKYDKKLGGQDESIVI